MTATKVSFKDLLEGEAAAPDAEMCEDCGKPSADCECEGKDCSECGAKDCKDHPKKNHKIKKETREYLEKMLAEAGSSFSKEVELHYSGKMVGQLDDIIVLQGAGIEKIAKLLGLDDDWKLKEGKVYAAYDGMRLTFFANKGDFQPEEEDAGTDGRKLPMASPRGKR